MDRLRRWRTNCKKALQRLLPTRGQHISRHNLASLSPYVEESPSASLYNGLQDGEIRLFELDINTTGNIVGRLQTVEISSAPPFYALSYVCGSDAFIEEITISNRAVHVGPNLFAAFKELRSYFEEKRFVKVAIWIDAICIDQGNENEKAKQIPKMHSVFAGAVEVLVWLGAVDDDVRMVLRVFAWISLYSNLAPALRQHGDEPGYHESITEPNMQDMDSLSRLQQCLEVHHRVSLTNLCAMGYFLTLRLLNDDKDKDSTFGEAIRAAMNVSLLDADLFPPDHLFWAALYIFLKLEWFRRTWTYQEITLAREAMILSQGVCVPWRMVSIYMEVLLSVLMFPGIFNKRSEDPRTRHLPPHHERTQSLLKWSQFRHPLSLSADSLPVLRSLVFTRLRVSTVAKDKVYGLIALWQSKIQAEIVIDYTTSTSTAEIFANAVKIGLKVDPEYQLTIADLWTAFEGPPPALATERLPSWCPDFQHYISPRDGDRRERSLSVAVSDRIDALACYEHTSGFKTISIRVLKLDTISKRTEAACPRVSQPTIGLLLDLLAWLHKIPEDLSSEHQANRSLSRDLQTFFYEDWHYLHSPDFTFDHFSKGLERLVPTGPILLSH